LAGKYEINNEGTKERRRRIQKPGIGKNVRISVSFDKRADRPTNAAA